ncbi:MAG: hypothetical protein QM619_03710 [Micropruina sp.]
MTRYARWGDEVRRRMLDAAHARLCRPVGPWFDRAVAVFGNPV